MTTTALPTSSTIAAPFRLRWSTLLGVELRKTVDTRSGRALLATTFGLVAAVLAWKVTHSDVAPAFDNYSRGTATFVAFVMPLVGLLSITSEWTQRTALTTFTLAPRRLPVLAAKYVSALVLALAVLVVGLVLALGATALAGALHGPADFTDLAVHARGAVAMVLLQVTMGCAFGALAANTPVALSTFLLAPTVWATVSTSLLGSAAPWLDVFSAYERLSSAHPATELAQTLTAIAVWVVVPAAIGLWQAMRREVS
jgi:ABC-type transport system involved in multi-copper enzyme maturation permease subunit